MQSSYIKNLDNIKKIHFIGIGGSGMFPIARILKEKVYEITGSDIYESDTIEKVRNIGITVSMEQKEENIVDQDLVVFSAAIKDENPEIIAAKNKNIPMIERSVMLGIIFKDYKNSIGVAGTHGKTTTTSMITSILIDAGKDPTAVIGGTLNKIKGNSCLGKSDIIVGEACEYVDSFLELYPYCSVITNVDSDHLDYFKTFDNVKKSFRQFASQTSGLLVVNGDDKNARECVKDLETKAIFFGFSKNNDYYADNILFNEFQMATFSIMHKDEEIANISLSVPGKHNIYNAMAAFLVSKNLGAETEKICESLKNFKGAHRRFEILEKINGITVADDFAHHPTEIESTLNFVKKMNFKRVWTVFQPHTYSRTFMFINEFAKALSISDKVVISDILPVIEFNIYGINSENLVNKIPNAVYVPIFEEIADFIVNNATSGDLVLTMGGGNVYKCADMIVSRLKKSF